MLDILGKRYLFFALSLLVIVPGLIILAVNGLPLAIDFKGGSILELRFPSGNLPDTESVVNLYTELGFKEVQVQTALSPSGQRDLLVIRSPFIDDETKIKIVQTMQERFNAPDIVVNRFDSVGPVIAQQVTERAALAVAVAALAVVLYITYAFRGIPHAFRYGVCAIIAMIHDILVVFSLVGIGSILFGWQMDSLFLTALLTVVGFSTQDKIVVFDRIRENSSIYRKLPFEKLANHSIIQTLQRSINTQLMTVEFMLLSLALFGGVTLREFAVILLVGLFSGTYSSIFVAAPILVVWENQEWKTWFKRQATA
ncbi:MAG: protein translocase subunit SecF [Thermanaerothrix sp.]|uniref:Protein-export membrane protein SecF n=1 Tax=Thermanaerothrix solaris TaxID=3058434 RepID=A0ABU3NL33_9CHLR|nr:protein translocase subunit SecF [Thermanaerothrix sp. 4228-RoL]MDT8896928.1 protein translocase subunit SecF [Thermanaerothrix sp. 4228-RoL]